MASEYPPIGSGMATSQKGKKSAKGNPMLSPVLKSTLLQAPMMASGPKFNDEDTIKYRKRLTEDKVAASRKHTVRVTDARVDERRYLKAQYEFEREKRLAERTVYHEEKTQEWRRRLQSSPLRVNLYSDGKRVFNDHRTNETERQRGLKRDAMMRRRERSDQQQKAILRSVGTEPDTRSAATRARDHRRDLRRQHEAEQRELAEMRERQKEEDARRLQDERDREAALAAERGDNYEEFAGDDNAPTGDEGEGGGEDSEELKGEVGKGAPDGEKEGAGSDVSDDRSSYNEDNAE